MSATKDLDSVIQRASIALGYPQLRPKQYEAVKLFLEGNDVFVVLPTGSGKSLCYGILPFAFNDLLDRESSIVIVISPLKALMKDQVASLSSKDLAAAFVDAETIKDKDKLKRIYSGQFSLLYISPELLLLNLAFREMMRTPVYMNNIVAFVIDEAHCVTKWGEHFRTEFANLGEVRSLIPSHVHAMALTATATKRTVARVSAILGLEDPKLITVSPDKPNMCYCVKPRGKLEDLCAPLVARLRHQRTAMPRVIIYCKKCEDCASIYYFFLSSLRNEFTEPISAPNLSQFRLVDMYTGVTHKDVQDSIIVSFRDPAAPLRVVVATVAFGMGVDCSGVSQIIHWRPPADMESYLQECGRAGRNGEFSCALLYVKKSDLRYLSDEAKHYCSNQTVCRRKILHSFFNQTPDNSFPTGCSCCDICASLCTCSNCKCRDFPVSLL